MKSRGCAAFALRGWAARVPKRESGPETAAAMTDLEAAFRRGQKECEPEVKGELMVN